MNYDQKPFSQIWNNFGTTVLPLCDSVAQEAVRDNKDPKEIGEFESVEIQKAIFESTYSKYRFFRIIVSWIRIRKDSNPYASVANLDLNGSEKFYLLPIRIQLRIQNDLTSRIRIRDDLTSRIGD